MYHNINECCVPTISKMYNGMKCLLYECLFGYVEVIDLSEMEDKADS